MDPESIVVKIDEQVVVTTTNQQEQIPTFFTVIENKFIDLKLIENDQIPSEAFLTCCSELFTLLDNFGSTAFLPVKVDVYGNINKLKQKYSIDPIRYHTIQNIVQHEIDENVTRVRNSATDALMWLMRGIWFFRELLNEFSSKCTPSSSMNDLSECAYSSYQKTLKKYHNWVVRSIFSLAMRSLPSKETFISGLAVNKDDYVNNKEAFEKQIMEDIKLTVKGMDIVLKIINDFYLKSQLEI